MNQTTRILPGFRLASAVLLTTLAATALTAGSDAERPVPSTAGQVRDLPEMVVTASRLDEALPGANITFLGREEINQSTARNVPELLGDQAGLQMTSLFGGQSAARASVDIRGMGATAASNSLFLLNGRRLNPVDSGEVQFASIPLFSLERVEIVRGSTAAVLYGDRAVGGAVNFITDPVPFPDTPFGARVDGAFGSYGYSETRLAGAYLQDGTSVSLHGSYTDDDGYRENNALIQRNLLAELRQRFGETQLYLSLSLDKQSLGLPGGLTRQQMEENRRQAATLNDFNRRRGYSLLAGWTIPFFDESELVIDGSYRRRTFDAFNDFGGGFTSEMNLSQQGWAFTPRVELRREIRGYPTETTLGLDLQHDTYRAVADFPFNSDGFQDTLAPYILTRVQTGPHTRISGGLRYQRVDLDYQDDDFDTTEHEPAFHLGIDRQVTERWEGFSRIGRTFRIPQIDERGYTDAATPGDLKVQTSVDGEFGLRYVRRNWNWQGSVFLARFRNEIRFDPQAGAFGANTNMDATRRIGLENNLTYRPTDRLILRGNLSYIEAEFRKGAFSGNRVPLVSPWSGSFSSDFILTEEISLAGALRYASSAFLGGDKPNEQERIPSYYVVDVVLRGQRDFLYWEAGVNNLFDRDYYTTGIDNSPFGENTFFPLPERAGYARVGLRF